MAISRPSPRCWIRRSILSFAPIALLASLASPARARGPAGGRRGAAAYPHPAPIRPIRPMMPRPMPMRPIMTRPMRSNATAFRYRPLMPRFPVGAQGHVAAGLFTPSFFAADDFDGRRTPGLAPGTRGYAGMGYFGGSFFGGPGGWGSRNNEMLPLGFGLWPACDSASIPGRFWTIGPCAGMGDYASLTPGYSSEYMLENVPQPYAYEMAPEIFLQEPQATAPEAKQPSTPAKKPNMVVYLTDGRAVPVSDWWVTEGRFYFITLSGRTESVDLPTLDLQKTIEQNEKDGLTFILNFTPPNERPVLPALP